MRFPIKSLAVGALALMAFTLARGFAEPESPWRLQDRIHGEALAFLSIEDVAGTGARLEQTALAKMFAEPEMKAFLQPLMAMAEQMTGEQGPLAQMPPAVRSLLEQIGNLQGQIAIALLGMDPATGQPTVVASLDFGKNVASFQQFLQTAKDELDPEGEHVKVVERGGRSWWDIRFEGGPPLTATVHGTTFVMGTDPDAMAGLLDGQAHAALSAEGGTFTSLRTRAGGDDLAVFAYVNVPRIVELLRDGPLGDRELAMANALGLDTVRGVAYGMSFQGDGFRDAFLLDTTGAEHGLATLLDMPPYEPRFLKHVPANAFYYAEGKASYDQLIEKVRGIAKAIDPRAVEEMDQGLAWIGDQLGVDIEGELLAGLDGSAAAYAAFPETGGLFPEYVYFLGAKDPTAFEATMDRFVQGLAGMLTQEGDVIATTRTLDYRGVTLHVLELQGDRRREMVPFMPTWARLGDAFAISLVPHTLKEVVLRAESGGPAHGGLAAQEDFQEILAARPRDAGTVGYLDLQGILTLLYDTGAPLLQMLVKPNMLPPDMPPMDFALLPATRTLRPYLRSVGIYSTWNRDGISVAVQGPIPMAAVVMAVAAVAGFAMARGVAMAPAQEAELDRVMRKPTEASSLERVQRDMAEIQARDLARSVRLFVLKNDRIPDTLEELIESDVVKVLPKDPWGNSFRFVPVDTAAKRFQLVSAGPDGDLGTGDDISIDG
ncbi:MAG: type II secretion system protein GspG [Planctomycetota bacterium]